MFQAVGNDAKRKRLGAADGVVPGRAIAHDACQFRHFRDPAAVGFLLTVEGVVHGRPHSLRAAVYMDGHPSRWRPNQRLASVVPGVMVPGVRSLMLRPAATETGRGGEMKDLAVLVVDVERAG